MASFNEVWGRVESLAAYENGGIDPGVIDINSEINVWLDSLETASFLIGVELEFNVMIPADATTFKDVVEYIIEV